AAFFTHAAADSLMLILKAPCYYSIPTFENRSHLFIQSSRDHRDLHSFPTRRSSDLASACIYAAGAGNTRQLWPRAHSRGAASDLGVALCSDAGAGTVPRPCPRSSMDRATAF